MRKTKNKSELPVTLDPVAGNGLLDRRLFLKKGLTFTAFTATTAAVPSIIAEASSGDSENRAEIEPVRPPWMRQPGESFSPYGVPSPHEDKVIRLATADRSETS
jgi:sulfane dehydrogenase subunit SoxC